MEHLVFVYGTLRRGYGNHYLINKNPALKNPPNFIAEVITTKKYRLTANGIPFLHPTKRKGAAHVKGEVYRVGDLMLERLDRLEGYNREEPGKSYYKREKILVKTSEGEEMEAWVYFCDRREGRLIPSGDYADYAEPRF